MSHPLWPAAFAVRDYLLGKHEKQKQIQAECKHEFIALPPTQLKYKLECVKCRMVSEVDKQTFDMVCDSK